uniref:Uncharacterized protein n=1 Tax=Electrophorus electricus TaxID=8005 RepID=A0A4W4GJ26_ELEEL
DAPCTFLLWTPQTSQMYGFSPVCVRICDDITLREVNAFSHVSHLWDLDGTVSSVRVKVAPHSSQVYGVLPVCNSRCRSRWYFWMKPLPHWSHMCIFLPVNSRTH